MSSSAATAVRWRIITAMDAALKQVLTWLAGGDARRDGSDVSADRRRLVEQPPAGAG